MKKAIKHKTKLHTTGRVLRRVRRVSASFITIMIVLWGMNGGSVLAFTTPGAETNPSNQADVDSYQTDTVWYDPTACGASTQPNATVTSSSSGSSSGGTWNSGLQPPYILEQIMIEALKDLAAKRGVPATSTVTEEHVVALVAFAMGEGGDINNHDIFNPLNTGINAPDLIDGAHATNGVQSFKSFDAGVEALARVFNGTYQHRLSDVLVQPGSTAQQFMEALTYFQRYPGNKYWAQASANNGTDGSDTIIPAVQDKYYADRLKLVTQVRNNWQKTAALVIGTPELEQQTGRVVPSKLTYHPVSGQDSNPATQTGGVDTSGQNCTCTTGASGTTIVIDPGHSGGKGEQTTDPATKIKDYDYPSDGPEMQDVFKVAQQVADGLRKAGYNPVLTKNNVDDIKSLRGRADMAKQYNAALGVSIHTQASGSNGGGLPWQTANNIVYPQAVGLYRTNVNKVNVELTKDHEATAKKSQDYANIFVQERTAAEGHSVQMNNPGNNFAVTSIDGRGLAPGNIWMVQLFAGLDNFPWIYNEAGGDSAGQKGLSAADQTKYANGIINSVKKAIPLGQANAITTNTTSSADCPAGVGTAGKGALIPTILKYAWPNYCRAGSGSCNGYPSPVTKNAAYAAATQAAKDRHEYIGDCAGVDCGAFVTRAMRDSGADPQYNKSNCNTKCQLQYLVDNSGPGKKYTKITDLNKLEPGDIAIQHNDSIKHTFFYVGSQPGFNGDTASASQCGRAPMAGPLGSNRGDFEWYRLNM